MTDFQEAGLSSPLENVAERALVSGVSGPWIPVAEPVRSSAVLRDIAGQDADLARVWLDLCSGQKRLSDVFYTEDRCYAVLECFPQLEPRVRPIEGRKLTILGRVLMGHPQKAVAIELGLAASTVAAMVGGCLRSMGCTCRSSSPPILLVMAAHAANGRGGVSGARLGVFVEGGREGWVLSAPRPDLRLPSRLSKAETAILHRLVEGHSLADIAHNRRTSRRTIANQLAALFRKVGVSGRAALLGALVVHALEFERARLS